MADISESEFLKANYSVKVIRLDKKFVLQNEELCLVTQAHDTIEPAYEELQKEQSELFERLQDIGELGRLPGPLRDKKNQEIQKQLRPFLFKSAIFALVGALLIATATISSSYILQTTPRKLALQTGRAAISVFIKELENFTAGEMTPEKEEQIRLLIRKAVAKAQIYTSELAPLFECKAQN